MRLIEDLQLEFSPPKQYGGDYHKMTLSQLKWHLVGSGPVNAKAYPKGGAGIRKEWMPKKKAKDPKTGETIEVPTDGPSPEEHNQIVQDYFKKVKMNLAPSPKRLAQKSKSINAVKKRFKSPHPKYGVYDSQAKAWKSEKEAREQGLKQSAQPAPAPVKPAPKPTKPAPKLKFKPKSTKKPKPKPKPAPKPKVDPKDVLARRQTLMGIRSRPYYKPHVDESIDPLIQILDRILND